MNKKPLLAISLLGLVFLLLLAGCRNDDSGTATAVPVSDPGSETEDSAPDNGQPAPDQPDTTAPEEPARSPSPLITEQLPEAAVINPPTNVGGTATTTGGSVQHTVTQGEWLMQIARCYGTSYTAVLKANPGLYNPNFLLPGKTVITVSNVGSTGPVIGAPCVQRYTVQAGDTWQSLAQSYQTTAAILQRANPGLLFAGRVVFVPTITSGSVSIPSFNRDLLFNYDGNLAVWRSGDGRVDLYSDANTYILDLATNDTGDFVLVRQIRLSDEATEFALINRASGTKSIITTILADDLIPNDQPFNTTMVISADGQWAAYLTGKTGSFRVTAFPTAAPNVFKTLAVNHGSDDLPPRLFAGADNDHFLLFDGSGIYEMDYAQTTGEKQLRAIDPNDFSNPLLFEGVAWSPVGRYLLMQGYYMEGGTYFVMDKETGQIKDLPGSGGYVSVGTAAWLMDGTAVVISPYTDSDEAGPFFATYKPEIINDTLTVSPVIATTSLSGVGSSSDGFGYLIASPPVQTAPNQYVMAIQAETAGLWALPIGDTFALNKLNQMPTSFWQLKWLPDSSGVLVDSPGQADTVGDVIYVPTDGGQPFSLLNWLGLKIADFHWVSPSETDGDGLQANCFPATLTPQGDICFFFFGEPVANNPTALNVNTIELSVGLGPALQTIDVPQETAAPYEIQNFGLTVEDMNYDGYDDFRFINFLPASGSTPYLYYIYDPASSQFVYNEAYEPITSPEFIGNNEIQSYWRAGAGYWGVDTYFLFEGVPTLAEREEWEVVNETEATHRITTFDYATDTSAVILEEVVPIPK